MQCFSANTDGRGKKYPLSW
jgi:hypothetical protein